MTDGLEWRFVRGSKAAALKLPWVRGAPSWRLSHGSGVRLRRRWEVGHEPLLRRRRQGQHHLHHQNTSLGPSNAATTASTTACSSKSASLALKARLALAAAVDPSFLLQWGRSLQTSRHDVNIEDYGYTGLPDATLFKAIFSSVTLPLRTKLQLIYPSFHVATVK